MTTLIVICRTNYRSETPCYAMIKDNLNNSDNLLPDRCLPDLWRFILVMVVD